jgi:hypothetical protein
MLVFIPACTTGQGDNRLTAEQTIGQNAVAEQSASHTRCADPNKADVVGSLWGDLWTLPDTIVEESSEILATDKNLMYLLMAGGTSIAMHSTNADRKIAENFNLNRVLGKEVDEIVSNLGGPGIHFAATGLWYAISVDKGDELNKQRAWTMMKALSITGATTMGLKLIVNNDTPNEKWLAWPSGHTASSFTVASVLDELYGPEVGFPAYLAASFVGYRMMDSGDHWASDVVFGAVLGWIVGHHIGGQHKALELGGFEVLPYTDISSNGPAVGVSFVKKF